MVKDTLKQSEFQGKMKDQAAVYIVRFKENPDEILYIGSTISTKRRFVKEHWNPKYRRHFDFGKWLHADDNLSKVKFEILEVVTGFEGEELKRELRRREFLWKRKMSPQKFGKLDGLKYQPEEVQKQRRREQNKKFNKENRVKYNKIKREKQSKLYSENVDHIQIEIHNEYQRRFRAKKNKNNPKFKPRGPRKKLPYCPKRAKKLARKRELYKLKLEQAGKVYKPRNTRIKRLEKQYIQQKPADAPDT